MSRRITDRERLIDYSMQGDLESVQADLVLMKRIVANRVEASTPAFVATAKPKRKRRTKKEIAESKAAEQGA